jgi:hypothetical protein
MPHNLFKRNGYMWNELILGTGNELMELTVSLLGISESKNANRCTTSPKNGQSEIIGNGHIVGFVRETA